MDKHIKVLKQVLEFLHLERTKAEQKIDKLNLMITEIEALDLPEDEIDL